MIKAAFMSQNLNKGLIDRVYGHESMARISKHAVIYEELINRDNLDTHKEYLKDVEVIFSTWGMPVLSKQDIERYLPKLKAVFYAAGSVQRFARPLLDRGVIVCSAWAANAIPVAEYTLALILLANKGFFQNSVKTKRNHASARDYTETFPGNYNVKVGILGAGMVGTRVIELLKPFSVEVLVFDPFLPDEKAEKLGVKKCSLVEIFSQCQTVSNHVANLPSTVKMLNKEHFSRMLPNATFINTGRGAQVVEEDLIKALKEIPTRTAILDVTDPEPPAPGSELLKMENVILTSHIAGSMGCEVERMSLYMTEEFLRYVEGKELKYNVTLKMLETMA
ncbi:MAG: hydroxyacid dehydrogenase [Clostridiaceae bacterium]|nr:hydroxyacid dehydrogenase [Clostridiaceae bacterium]